MADEILYAGVANETTAETLTTDYLQLLADRQALPQHPALMYIGDTNGSSSITKKIPVLGLMGYDLLQATSDGTSVANTPLSDASATVSVGRYSKAYSKSDVVAMMTNGLLNSQAFALDSVASAATTLLSIMSNITDDFTNTVGTSGSPLTIAQFQAAINTLEVANVAPPYLSLLHLVQVGNLKAALLNATGTIEHEPASSEQINLLGPGYRGRFLGADLFATNHVPLANAGSDRAGGIFGRGAVAWSDSSFVAENDANQLLIGGKVLFERDRTARAGLTSYVTHAYFGASKAIDEAGVSIITGA